MTVANQPLVNTSSTGYSMHVVATLGDTSEDYHHHHHRTSRQGLEHHRLCIIVFKALSYHHQGINKTTYLIRQEDLLQQQGLSNISLHHIISSLSMLC